MPVLYAPYFNFPIDDCRQSGFLFPTYSTSSINGVGIGLPYYWNIAPNYDDTITPRIYTESGFQLSNQFRYLTPSSNGTFTLSYLPDDRAFAEFQNQAKTDFLGNVALPRLEDDNDYRGFISWQDSTQINDNWSLSVNYTRVSDDYYLEDYVTPLSSSLINYCNKQPLIMRVIIGIFRVDCRVFKHYILSIRQ